MSITSDQKCIQKKKVTLAFVLLWHPSTVRMDQGASGRISMEMMSSHILCFFHLTIRDIIIQILLSVSHETWKTILNFFWVQRENKKRSRGVYHRKERIPIQKKRSQREWGREREPKGRNDFSSDSSRGEILHPPHAVRGAPELRVVHVARWSMA